MKLGGIENDTDTTNSLLEFQRLNSPYIMHGANEKWITFADVLRPELDLSTTPAKKARDKPKPTDAPADDTPADKERDDVAGVVDLRKLATVCFKYDPNSLVHGVFLEKIAGRLRHPRALSAFIEASGVGRADSGGVKFDRVLPKPSVANVAAKDGYGNVPFHRTEFTAKSIIAFFSLDLAQVRGYGLPPKRPTSSWSCRFGRSAGSSIRTCDCVPHVNSRSTKKRRVSRSNDPTASVFPRQRPWRSNSPI